jgi:RNA polymerase sigma-70 factor (ECF subfamily)
MTGSLSPALAYARLSETALVRLAQEGDRDAFRAIMTRCNQRLFRIARGVLGDDTEAEDALQEAYLRAFAGIAGFRSESSLQTWLSTIVLNEARGRLRRRRPQVALALIDEQPNVVALPLAPPPNPEVEAARAETRRLLERALDRLPSDFRVVFLLRDVEGCSVEETAEQLGILAATVKTRLFRARRMLRAALDEGMAEVLRDAFPFLGARCEGISDRVLERMAHWP